MSMIAQLAVAAAVYAIDRPYCYSFSPVASEKWKLRIRVIPSPANPPFTETNSLMIHRMRVYYQTQGEIEASNPDL